MLNKSNLITSPTLGDTEIVSAQRCLDIMGNTEKTKPVEVKFVPPTIGESGFGHFLVKWHYPKYANVRAG